MKLVIIAAGQGSRLRTETNSKPKALTNINGSTIIDIILNNCKVNGINDVLIITGHNRSSIGQYLKGKWTNLNIEFIHNEDWRSENGLSVLKAKSAISKNEEFMISMSDHLYFPDLMNKVKKSSLSTTVANVGLDFNIHDIFDIDDGMKVMVRSETMLIEAMSKKLTIYNAIDVGLFKCSYDFFSFLESLNKAGSCSLSVGCNLLIKQKLLGGVDIEDSFWLDIDTPESLHFSRRNNMVSKLIEKQDLN